MSWAVVTRGASQVSAENVTSNTQRMAHISNEAVRAVVAVAEVPELPAFGNDDSQPVVRQQHRVAAAVVQRGRRAGREGRGLLFGRQQRVDAGQLTSLGNGSSQVTVKRK